MRPTLVFIRHLQIGDRFFHHGDELPPDLLPQEAMDWHLDHRDLIEHPDRRSLYRLFAPFSGCEEKEQLTADELTSYALPQ